MFNLKKIFIILTSLFLFSCGGNADIVKVGDSAPNFSLQDANGKTFTLADYKDKSPLVIYFYPKANTPGCTKEACGIRDDFSEFKKNNIAIFGISVDSKEDIKEFVNDYNLNFPLLSDIEKTTSKKYGVLNNLGFANRITFVIDKKGKIAKILKNFDIEKHSGLVLDIAKELN